MSATKRDISIWTGSLVMADAQYNQSVHLSKSRLNNLSNDVKSGWPFLKTYRTLHFHIVTHSLTAFSALYP